MGEAFESITVPSFMTQGEKEEVVVEMEGTEEDEEDDDDDEEEEEAVEATESQPLIRDGSKVRRDWEGDALARLKPRYMDNRVILNRQCIDYYLLWKVHGQ